MKQKLVNIAYRGTPKHREVVQQAALDRGMKVKGLLDAALASYLGKSVPKTEQDSLPRSSENMLISEPLDPELTKLMEAARIARTVKNPIWQRRYRYMLEEIDFLAEVAELERSNGGADPTISPAPRIDYHTDSGKTGIIEIAGPKGARERNPRTPKS